MKGSKLYIRIINLLLIVIILLYYNSSMKTYALEEKKDKIQAELDAEKNYSSGLLEEMQEEQNRLRKQEMTVFTRMVHIQEMQKDMEEI
jgi:hypothetical protein